MASFFLSPKESKARLREAENARKNRLEIVKAYSQGQVSRRELMKWGLITAGGLLVPKNGLSPFARSAYGSIPTGAPRSPLFGAQAFTQPMPRFDVLPRKPYNAQGLFPMTPMDCYDESGNSYLGMVHQPEKKSNCDYLYNCDPLLGGGRGPVEGRPPGDVWAHQQ
jgi:hypothetical protein